MKSWMDDRVTGHTSSGEVESRATCVDVVLAAFRRVSGRCVKRQTGCFSFFFLLCTEAISLILQRRWELVQDDLKFRTVERSSRTIPLKKIAVTLCRAKCVRVTLCNFFLRLSLEFMFFSVQDWFHTSKEQIP